MVETLFPILLGIPSMLLGAVLLVLGLVFRRAWLVAAGALAGAGFCCYLAMNPAPLRYAGLLALGGNALAAVALRRESLPVAVALVLPYFVAIAYLTVVTRWA